MFSESVVQISTDLSEKKTISPTFEKKILKPKVLLKLLRAERHSHSCSSRVQKYHQAEREWLRQETHYEEVVSSNPCARY